MQRARLSSRKLSSYLKIDCFGERQTIRYPGQRIDYDIIHRSDFFTHLYTHVRNGKITGRTGEQDYYSEYDYEQWIKALKESLRSVIVFVEGYAGCGKSVFVQKILSEIFPNLDYDRNYYNYDIGFTFENNNQSRIKDAILECYIDQYVRFYREGQAVIVEKMEDLLKQEAIDQLDNARSIFYEFTATKAYLDAKKMLEEGDIPNFRKIIHDQLSRLTTEQIIYIDCILRLAKYVSDITEPETQIICYDNLDAIENNDELCDFDNVLQTVKENMDSFLSKSNINYIERGQPHFVFIATYRKITAVRVGLFEGSERYGDNRNQQENIFYIDGSHLFEYKQMVKNRYYYFREFVRTRHLEAELIDIVKKMEEVVELFRTSFVNSRYAGLWNNNYRTCSDIMERIVSDYEVEAKQCIKLTKSRYDDYDEHINVAIGASAVFLSIICRVQRDCNYWGNKHLDIIDLNGPVPTRKELEQNKRNVRKLTTLSRLILTYVQNVYSVEERSVSTNELFGVFTPAFSVQDIACTLANMLKHDKAGIWRRPIVYTKNAIPNNADIYEELKRQGDNRENSDYLFSEITTCDCGDSFITRVSCDYEFYSARLGNSRSLYLAETVDEIKKVLDGVLEAVDCCCQKMILFRNYYTQNARMVGKYNDQLFHPRTFNKKPQLHTERVIFSHIEYLDNYRLYIQNCKDFNNEDKETIKGYLVETIGEYLKLYQEKIIKLDKRRASVATDLADALEKAKTATLVSSMRIHSNR